MSLVYKDGKDVIDLAVLAFVLLGINAIPLHCKSLVGGVFLRQHVADDDDDARVAAVILVQNLLHIKFV